MKKPILSAGLITVGLLLAIIIAFVQSTDQNSESAVVVTPANTFVEGGGGACPGTGSCYASNGTPGCVNGECCSLVCAIDPFCCDNTWDGICADEALTECPTGDICSVPTVIGNGSFAVNLSNNTASGLASSCVAGDDLDEWFRYTATACAATAEICTEFTDVDITIAVFDECDGSEIACEADHSDCPFNGDLNASVSWNTIAGDTYLIRVSGIGATTTLNFIGSLTVSAGGGSCLVANGTPGCDNGECCSNICAIDPFCCDVEWDSICAFEALALCVPGGECENAIPIGNGAFPVDLTDNNSLDDVDDTASCGAGDVIDEWYAFTATGCSATAEICTEFSEVDITIAIFDSCGGSEIACGDDYPGCSFGPGINAIVTWDTVPGETYNIRLSGAPLPPAGGASMFIGTLRVESTPGGTVDSGDPFEPGGNGSPGSWNCECTNIVCALDPFCCNVAWDGICANLALANCPPPCEGDVPFASPGTVDIADLLAVLAAWGSTGPNVPEDVAPPPAGNGIVDIGDLLLVLGAWGACP